MSLKQTAIILWCCAKNKILYPIFFGFNKFEPPAFFGADNLGKSLSLFWEFPDFILLLFNNSSNSIDIILFPVFGEYILKTFCPYSEKTIKSILLIKTPLVTSFLCVKLSFNFYIYI